MGCHSCKEKLKISNQIRRNKGPFMVAMTVILLVVFLLLVLLQLLF
jgi:uncharacterized membrane protein (DUF485 family)